MKPSYPSRGGLVVRIPAWVAFVFPLTAAPVVWDNSNATGVWSTAANWDTNVEPTAADEVTFPLGLAGTITTTTTENALSLTFNDAYTLSGGTLALVSGNSISVANGVTATINNSLTIAGGLSKTGTGTLVLTALNTNPGGTVISAGKLRVSGNASALGAAGVVTTVNGGATLEVAGGYTLDRLITLMQGGTVAGLGTAINNGKITIDAAATSVTLATDQASDVFTVGNGANDVTGGSLVAGTTVIGIAGPGSVRLGAASDFDGSWSIPAGRLELGAAAALGDQATSSVTLSGGTLAPRLATATSFTGPASNLIVTADSGLLSDRSTVNVGVTYTLGTLSIGAHTLTVAPGAGANSGTAGINLGNVTLTGNPTFAVHDAGSVNGKLTTGSILGGSARTLAKTGAGDLAVTGGSTDLPAGSTFTATGGGTIEMLFPSLGATTSVAITAAQNPFGEASVSVTDGALRLLADGSGTAAVQTYQLPTPIALGGGVTLDPDRRTAAANTNKIFELPGLTLAADTVLGMSGNNTHGVRLTGPLALSGDATLQGVPLASQDGLLTLNGGISGAAGDSLTIAGGTSPMNLTINAASTYGGGTAMSGSNVTLNAANAFGPGATSISGGSLVVNTDGALNGTVTVTGGTLRVNDTNALAANPISLDGGTLDFRNNTTATITTGTLTVSGTSGLSIGNNGSGGSQVFDFPHLDVSGDTVLTVTPVTTTFVPNFQVIDLAGNLTLSNTNTARVQTITEDAFPRTLIKTGIGTLEMEAASSHSGGTEVTAGILLVEHAGALTVGATSGTATATAQFNSSLTLPNNLVVRSGGSGTLTFDAPAGGVTWNGGLSLQKGVTVDNGSASVPSSFNGVISGTGTITKVSAGEIILGNTANSFTGTLAINDGTLSVASDGALGDPANGVTLAGDAILKIDSTFATSRTITSGGATNSVSVSGANEFTVNSALAGAGSFIKSGTGILTLGAAVDSSARGGATSSITGGTLRVQGVKNLSDTGILTLNGSSGTIEFLLDADTVFPHPVTADGTGTLHVDRAIGGVASNGRHTLGTLGMVSGTLTVTGANGYGLSFGAATVSSNNTLTNNAPGALRLASFTGNPGSSNLFVTFAGSGDIEITGALTEGAGTGNYGIGKNGPGTLRFGSSVTEFGRFATIQDGTLDLNGLIYPVSALTFGGLASVSGATIVTGASGSLVLGGDVFFDAITTGQAGALLSGNLGLGAASRNFNIENNATAAADLTLDGPIGGSPGAAILKSGAGTLRLAGAGNTQPGLVSITAGVLELAKSGGDAIGTGGLSLINNGTSVRLAGNDQIADAASIAVGNSSFLELDNFSDATGPITFTQTTPNQYGAIKTGATGTLVLNGNLTFNNNTDNSTTTDERNVLITGTGTKSVPTTTGTLDLGGAIRTIHVATTTVSANATRANATIETQIISGGILKTGPRTLFLSHPNNTFAGGLQIAQGFVRPGSGSSLGLGPVTFTNAPGTAAGFDFGSLTGTVPNTIVTGTGDFTFTYAAAAPNVLTLSGGFDLEQNLTVDVVNGSVQNGTPTEVLRAVVDVTGVIDDGAGTFGLTKTGNGMLKLAAGNTYGGGTVVQKGILSLAADSSLGDTTVPLTLDGGCLGASNSFTLTRDLVIGAGGGSLRADTSRVMEIAGTLDWGSATTGTDGSGRIVISGPTTGAGNLKVGEAIAFAPGTLGQ
jgi:autotransporter-associated beta strand protein